METAITVSATKRTGGGKGPARRLRVAGQLPAVMYGPGQQGISISVDPKTIKQILTAPRGRNTVVSLDVAGTKQLAMLRSFDLHPVTREIEHADFYTVALDRAITVDVPFVTTGKAKGVAMGGVLRQVFRKLPVKCTPDAIPEKIEVDVTNLEQGNAIHTRDLHLPPGVVVHLEPGLTLVAIVAPEKEEVVVAVEGAVAAVPGAAAPAAGAAGAAAPAAAGAPAGKAPAAGEKKAEPAAKKK